MLEDDAVVAVLVRAGVVDVISVEVDVAANPVVVVVAVVLLVAVVDVVAVV